LLHEERVHEAKEELERALRLQPRDPKGQDLLGLVYFRLGMYPRAIGIYEELAAAFPRELKPRVNLGLCFLKTGQPERARAELEQALRLDARHMRAWAYLGLAYEKLRDFDKASIAFERAGQRSMARRMSALGSAPARASSDSHPAQTLDTEVRGELRLAAAEAFHELDVGDLSFSMAPPAVTTSAPAGQWQPLEPGHDPVIPSVHASSVVPVPRPAIAPAPSPDLGERPSPVATPAAQAPAPAADEGPSGEERRTPLLADWAREHAVDFPEKPRVLRRHDGLVAVSADEGFVARLDLARAAHALAPPLRAMVLSKLSQGRYGDQPLGPPDRPLSLLQGPLRLVLAPGRGRSLLVFELEGSFVYVREELLGAFDASLLYENGRLPAGDGEQAPMVQVRGSGFVVLDLPLQTASVQVAGGLDAMVRREAVLGWTGRMMPRALSISEAPAGTRGWVVFSGLGSVLVDAMPGAGP
jgi:hypothetical protein